MKEILTCHRGRPNSTELEISYAIQIELRPLVSFFHNRGTLLQMISENDNDQTSSLNEIVMRHISAAYIGKQSPQDNDTSCDER